MLQSNQSSLCGLHGSRNRWEGGPNGPIVSIKRAADGRAQRGRKIIYKKREKYRANNGSLQNTSTDSKGATFAILINHASAPVRKERLSPSSKVGRKVSRNEFVEKVGPTDIAESFGELYSSIKNCLRARPGFVKPIQNRLRKIKNSIQSRQFRAETSLAGRANGIKFQKEE